MPLCRGGRGCGSGGASGPYRRRERTRQVVRSQPVVSEHRAGIEVGARQLGLVLDRLGIGLVKLGPLSWKEILVDRGPAQLVTEAESAAGRIDHQQLLLHGL